MTMVDPGTGKTAGDELPRQGSSNVKTTQGTTGMGHAPGWFLADSENCTRVTGQIPADSELVKTAPNGGKYMPMGSLIMGGIVYEDVDVTYGDAPGSLVTRGAVYLDRLNISSDEAQTVAEELAESGFTVIPTAPTVTRPDWDEEEGGGDEGGGEDQGDDNQPQS